MYFYFQMNKVKYLAPDLSVIQIKGTRLRALQKTLIWGWSTKIGCANNNMHKQQYLH